MKYGVQRKLWKSNHFLNEKLYIHFSGSNALPGQSREGGTQRGKSQADPDKRHIWLQGLTNINCKVWQILNGYFWQKKWLQGLIIDCKVN